MKKVFFLLAVVGLMTTVHPTAQNPGQEFTYQMNHIFQYVDKSRISTGLLSDYGLQIVDPLYFNGVPADSNYVDMDSWVMLFAGLYSSKINNNVSFTDPETIFEAINNASHPTAVPVAMMHYQYNALREDAFSLGLMQVVNNDQLQDGPSFAASPYLTRQLFAVAPKELYFASNVASFVFNSSLWHTNVNKTIQKREINFNNESGYIIAGWNDPKSYAFTTGGVKTVYFRLTYTDGTSYTSQTNIFVMDQGSLLKSGNKPPRPDSLMIAPLHNVHSGGKIQWKLSSKNTTGSFVKPLIVAEGFDPYPLVGKRNNDLITFLYGNDNDLKLDIPSPINSSGGRTLYSDLDFAEYDVIYLDYADGVDDIKRNAALFRKVIEWVNTIKQENNSTEPNIVMGMSMGGLVARIALRQMEIAGVNHQTKKYISVDSPHKGANMPVGFQAMIRHIQNTNVLLFATIFDISTFQLISPLEQLFKLYGMIDLLNSVAAQQMLIYYIEDPGLAQYLPWTSINYNHTVHNNFQSFYDGLGFPQQTIENITISNGSRLGSANGGNLFAPGSPIIDFNKTIDYGKFMNIGYGILLALPTYSPIVAPLLPMFALNAVTTRSELKAELKINALQNQSVSMVYKGRIYIRKVIKTPWPFSNIVIDNDIENVTQNSEGNMHPLDGAPGGMFDMSAFAGDLPFPDNAIKQSKFCFIPTGSSLAMSSLIQTSNITPASNQFVPITNEPHVDFRSSALFFCDKLNIPFISGDNSICYNSSVFTINNSPGGITWTVSDPLITISPSTGNSTTVTHSGTNTGNFTLQARTGGSNGEVVATKTVGTCLPPTISGTTLICSNASSDFSATTNWQPGYTWNKSSNLTISGSNSNSSVTVKGNSNNGEGWVSVNFGGVELVRHNLWVGTPLVQGINGPDPASLYEYNHYSPFYNSLSGASGFIWGVQPYSCSTFHSGTDVWVSFYDPDNTYEFSVYAHNGCGTGPIGTFYVSTSSRGSSPSIVYPNPANDVIYIDIDASIVSKSQTPYDVRLYDGLGNLQRQTFTYGGTVQFNVSNLPEGVYFIHVYDGVNNTPEIFSFIIER